MDDPAQDLMEQLEERFEYVVTMHRDVGASMDEAPEKGAFAFVIGRDSDNTMVIEGTTTGDGRTAIATIWALRDGRREELTITEIDGQVMLTANLF